MADPTVGDYVRYVDSCPLAAHCKGAYRLVNKMRGSWLIIRIGDSCFPFWEQKYNLIKISKDEVVALKMQE